MELMDYLKDAKAIAWDTCHKIYVAMDEGEVYTLRGYGYDPLHTSEELNPEQMLEVIKDWYSQSCGLRFIEACHSESGFTSIVYQFETDYDLVVG